MTGRRGHEAVSATYPRRALMAFLLVLGSFVIYSAPGRYGGTADTIPAQLLPLSLWREGNLDFNEFVCPTETATAEPIAYDAASCLTPLPYYFQAIDGRVVSLYPIVPGLLNVPVHILAILLGVDTAAARVELALITAALVTALAVAALFLLLLELNVEMSTAWLGTVTFALGTIAWSVTSRGLWQHGPSLLLLIAALWCIARKTPTTLAWAGFLLALAVFNRPSNAVLAAPLGWYVLKQYPFARSRFLLWCAIPLLLMLLYSFSMLGSVLTLGQGQHMRLGDHPFEGFAGVLFSPARGLFVFSPILLLGLLAVPHVLKHGFRIPLMRPLILGTAGVIVVHASWAVWWGGHSFGYRLLSEALPCLIILLAIAWERTIRARRWLVAASGVLFVAAVCANALGALVAPCGFDSQPNFIDYHPARLWNVADTELLRCTMRVVGGLYH